MILLICPNLKEIWYEVERKRHEGAKAYAVFEVILPFLFGRIDGLRGDTFPNLLTFKTKVWYEVERKRHEGAKAYAVFEVILPFLFGRIDGLRGDTFPNLLTFKTKDQGIISDPWSFLLKQNLSASTSFLRLFPFSDH